MLMKRSVPLLSLLFVCFSFTHAGYTGNFIGQGEYEGYIMWSSYVPPLIVNGGGANTIEVRENGRLEVQSTSTPLDLLGGGVYDISLVGHGTLLYLNGVTNSIRLAENATAILKGGSINFIRSYQNVFDTIVGIDEQGNWIFNTHIEMIVKTYNYDDTTDMLTGTWANNDDFAIKLLNADDYDPVFDNIKFTVVPEPATLLLLSLGGLLLRRRKR